MSAPSRFKFRVWHKYIHTGEMIYLDSLLELGKRGIPICRDSDQSTTSAMHPQEDPQPDTTEK